MRAYLAFCRKEWMESVRTYRLFIMLSVFVLIGIMNPMMALLLPRLLSGADLGGLVLELPEPTAMDSWAQFFSNMGQLGLMAMAVVFAGVTANEFSKDTLINMLTKGLSRRTVIASKLTVASLIWTLCYWLSVGITAAYTAFYWKPVELSYGFLALVGTWLLGLTLIALLALGGILFKSLMGSLMWTGGVAIVFTVLGLVPELGRFNLMDLPGSGFALVSGQLAVEDFWALLLSGTLVGIFSILATILVFDRKHL